MFTPVNWPVAASLILLRIGLAIAFLYILLPLAVLPRDGQDGHRYPLVANALIMAFISTACVHLLAAVHLYEAMVFLTLIVALGGLFWVRRLGLGTIRWVLKDIYGWFLDRLGGLSTVPLCPAGPMPAAPNLPVRGQWAGIGILAAALAVGAWMRLAEPFSTPAPSFADAPVNLAWAKYLELNSLYQDGVYPKGMYATLTLIRKFTALNTIEVLVIAGPLFGVLLLVSVAAFAYQVSGSIAAASAAALLYGTLPALLPYEFQRHASHNSQEFGMMFVLPAAWYAFTYLTSGRQTDGMAAGGAAGMAAFTHPIAAGFAWLAAAGTITIALLSGDSKIWRRLPALAGYLGAAAAAASAPLLAAVMSGIPWHQTSIAYAVTAPPAAPAPPALGYVLLLPALGLICALGIIAGRLDPRAAAGDRWRKLAAGSGVAAVATLIFMLPRLGLGSQALLDRGGEPGAVGLALAAAVAVALLERLVRPAAWLAALAVGLAGIILWQRYPPLPARPYHYYADEQIQLYLWADRTFRPGEWTLVTGHTGYALALGRAFHSLPGDFIQMAGRLPTTITRWHSSAAALGYGISQDYLLVVEKTVPALWVEPDDIVARRLAGSRALEQWIDEHRDTLPLTLILDGAEVAAWRLHVPAVQTEGRHLSWQLSAS